MPSCSKADTSEPPRGVLRLLWWEGSSGVTPTGGDIPGDRRVRVPEAPGANPAGMGQEGHLGAQTARGHAGQDVSAGL